MAKVMLQPEGIETGWLPVLSPWSANGWGIVIPLAEGDQVLLVCEEADGQNYAIKGRYFSDVDAAPSTLPVAGEFFMQSKGGAQLYFKADGSVSIVTPTALNVQAPTVNIAAANGGNAIVNITGSLNVSVETTTNGKAFTPHTHPYNPGGGAQTETGIPQG